MQDELCGLSPLTRVTQLVLHDGPAARGSINSTRQSTPLKQKGIVNRLRLAGLSFFSPQSGGFCISPRFGSFEPLSAKTLRDDMVDARCFMHRLLHRLENIRREKFRMIRPVQKVDFLHSQQKPAFAA